MKTQEAFEQEVRAQYGEAVELRVSEVRAASDDTLTVSGYAAMFDDITDLGYFKERIARGAFDGVMEDDVRLLINHAGVPLARTTNGTLDLEVDETGLRYTARLADTTEGRDLYKLIKRGDISQSSFAFTIAEEDYDRKANLRTITKMGSLLDVSPVTYPAYPTTTVAARMKAQQEERSIDPEDEELLDDILEAIDEIKVKIEEAKAVEEQEDVMPAAPVNSERSTFAQTKPQTMNLNELKALRAKYYEEHVALVENPDKEGRQITEAEEQRAEWLVAEVASLDKRIKHRADHEKMVARMVGGEAVSRGEEREIEKLNGKFSLSRAVLTAANGRSLEGIEAEWAQEAQREMRAQGLQAVGQVAIPMKALYRGAADNFTATIGNGDGEGFVPINVPGAIGSLISPSVIERLGTTVINGATGNLKFPRVSVAPAGTAEGEVDANANSGMEMDELTLSPQRVSAKTTYSKQLLLQGGAAVDMVIAQELNAAMNKFIDTKAFDTLDGATMNDLSTAGVTNTVFNAALAVAMEAAVLADGADLSNCYYVMSPYAYQLAKNLAQVSSVSALFDLSTNTFNGYRAIATPYLVDTTAGSVGQLLFGNFQQGAILAYFGGIDLLVDPYSAAGNAQIVLHVNRFFDFDVRQANALAKCNDAAAS
jgi:HK97 family phage prohead protease/HK97 family phage major capsid protein